MSKENDEQPEDIKNFAEENILEESKVVQEDTVSGIDNLKEYIKSVRRLADSESDFVFNNSNHEHASIVLTVMMEKAQDEFLIYDNDLSGDVADRYEGFYPAIKDFADRGTLKVVIEDGSQEHSKIYAILKELNAKYPARVQVKKSSNTFKTSINAIYETPLNFAVADSKAIRLEKVNKEQSVRKAICSFYRPKEASALKKKFDLEFEKCENVFQN